MRLLLVNDGGYGDMQNVVFPAEVEADELGCCKYSVKGAELIRIGATVNCEFPFDPDFGYVFVSYMDHCEVLPE